MQTHTLMLLAFGLLLTLAWTGAEASLSRRRKDRRKDREEEDDDDDDDGDDEEEESDIKVAECVVTKGIAYTDIEGKIVLSQKEGENTSIEVSLTGFNPNSTHGFHIHTTGDLGNNCTNAGGHFNPFDKGHGAPEDDYRHVGDLGNIVSGSDGKVTKTMDDRLVMLSGENSVIGRAFVIHFGVDDLGVNRDTDPGSNATGNAGARMACCIIKEGGSSSQASSVLHLSILLLVLSLVIHM